MHVVSPEEEKERLRWNGFAEKEGSREQFLHCGLRKFRHSKASVYM